MWTYAVPTAYDLESHERIKQMGRPLNKKYFGLAANEGIGGEGVASIDWSTLGAFQGNSNVQVLTALAALPAPALPTGVQATYTAQFEVESVFTGSGKTNLAVNDTFGVASIPGMIAKVTSVAGANAVFSVTAAGAARGDALALADIPQDTVGITLTKIAGPGTAATFLVDIVFRLKESTVTITEQGSGYIGTETFTFSKPDTTVGTVPAGTLVLTNTNENTIAVTAFIPGGASAKVSDAVKQTSSTRYRVTTADGTGVCSLVAGAPTEGEMNILALDSDGGEYYVTKLTARRCTIVQKTGTQFGNDDSVGWNLSAAVAGSVVKVVSN